MELKICSLLAFSYLYFYPGPQDVVRHRTLHGPMMGLWKVYKAGAMQDRESELLRIPLPRTPVNKAKEKGRSCFAPALPSYSSDRCLLHEGAEVEADKVVACAAVEGAVVEADHVVARFAVEGTVVAGDKVVVRPAEEDVTLSDRIYAINTTEATEQVGAIGDIASDDIVVALGAT